MVKVTLFKFTDAQITTLPPISSDPSTLDIRLERNANLDLCSCENVWLKQVIESGGTVTVDDAPCQGTLWSEMTKLELLAKCTGMPATQKEVKTHFVLQATGFFCPRPQMPEQYASSAMECGMRCSLIPGCQSYNYFEGRCILIAPYEIEGTVRPSEGEKWQFFTKV